MKIYRKGFAMSSGFLCINSFSGNKKRLLRSLILVFMTSICTVACKPEASVGNEVLEPKNTADIAVSPVVRSVESSVQSSTPLANVMSAFTSEKPATWSAFDKVSGVNWRDDSPSVSDSGQVSKMGTVLLLGFDQVAMPDGKVGVEAGVKNENEGLSGLTFTGTDKQVETIAVRKFRVDEKYAEVIARQFSTDTKVTLMADSCADEYNPKAANERNNTFFKLDLSPGNTLYVEAAVDKDGGNSGPGYTNYIFYQVEPIERIKLMNCHQL
jgi:hypothetical protein